MDSIAYKSEFGETIIFDPETYRKICEGCLITFFGKTKEEVEHILEESSYFNSADFPPKDYNQMALLDNETLFSIARESLRELDDPSADKHDSIPLKEYQQWEAAFIRENGLNPAYIRYIIE